MYRAFDAFSLSQNANAISHILSATQYESILSYCVACLIVAIGARAKIVRVVFGCVDRREKAQRSIFVESVLASSHHRCALAKREWFDGTAEWPRGCVDVYYQSALSSISWEKSTRRQALSQWQALSESVCVACAPSDYRLVYRNMEWTHTRDSLRYISSRFVGQIFRCRHQTRWLLDWMLECEQYFAVRLRHITHFVLCAPCVACKKNILKWFLT